MARSFCALMFATFSALATTPIALASPTGDETSPIQPAGFHGDVTCGCEASDGGDACCDSGCDNGCCGVGCRKVCVATVEKETVEKHCWKVEGKDLCVPKVVLPWQDGGSGLTLFNFLKKGKCGSGCAGTCCSDGYGKGGCSSGCCVIKPRCGKVITVCDLKKEKYECDKWVCQWEIRRLPPCCDCHGKVHCGDGCCP